MLEFLILMIILDLLMKLGGAKQEAAEPMNKYDNGKPEEEMLKKAWEFDNLDDAMEFRELRRSGWRGGVKEFYEWKLEQ